MVELDAEARAAYAELTRLDGRSLGLLGEDFQDVLLRDGKVDWKCRAGARVFHVCEDGLVHLCTPRHGRGAVPLADYTVADIRRAFATTKACAATCPVAYAHMASKVDRLRPQSALVDERTLPEAPARVAGRVYLPLAA
jgi:hypothetical protein